MSPLLDSLPSAPPIETAIWLLLYIIVLGAFWYRYKLHWLTWLIRRQPLLCAVLAMACASWFWSIEPDLTWKRAIHLVGTTLIGVYIGYHFTERTVLTILGYTLAIVIVGSILVAVALPEIGQQNYGGSAAWLGLCRNKNNLGFFAAIAAVLFVTGWLSGNLSAAASAALTAASLFTLVMARSATAVVVLAVGLAAISIFIASKRIRAPSVLTLCIVIVAGCSAAWVVATSQYLYDLTDTLGRDATFTHRTAIWAAAWDATMVHPWLGNGYGTLWSATEISPYFDFSWPVANAHNGLLNMTSQLGLFVGGLGLAYNLQGIIQATLLYKRHISALSLFSLAFFFMFLVENITEAYLFEHRQLGWLLFVTLSIAVNRQLRRRKRHSYRLLQDDVQERLELPTRPSYPPVPRPHPGAPSSRDGLVGTSWQRRGHRSKARP